MDPRDRMTNLGLFGLAAIAWALVALVVTTRDPLADSAAGLLGAGLICAGALVTALGRRQSP